MANLRDLIDGRAVDPMDKGDVYDHLKKTKVAQLNYDLAKAKLHNKLAPTRQMLDLVDKDHPMDDGQNQQYDEAGNPVGVPQNNQQMKPGMATNPNNPRQQTNQNIRQAAPMQQQKKSGFPNANKTSTANKIQQKKPTDKKPSGRGFEVHVKAGGQGSGRHKGSGSGKSKAELYQEKNELQMILHDDISDEQRDAINKRLKELENIKGERIDQMNVKKRKKLKGRYDYHDNAGVDQGAGRGMGLSGGGPGSGRRPSSGSVKGDDVPVHSNIHKVMVKHGYLYRGNDDSGKNSTYSSHYSNISVDKKGNWNRDKSGETIEYGRGSKSLNKHLSDG